MVCDGCNYFFIWGHFLPFYSLKNKDKKKMKKKHLEIFSFYASVPKIRILCYTVPEICRVTDVIVIFHFGYLLAFNPLNSPKNENFKKMKKTPSDIILFHLCTKNYD